MAEVELAAPPPRGAVRGRVDHVIILDGTLSSLDPGIETNAGLLFKLMTEGGLRADRTVYYEPGIQWEGWRHLGDIAQGRGINRQIRRAYGWLASHYREGDRIYLIGYSRGAFAVRSLAGVIDRVGLLKREHATERGVTLAYRHYRNDGDSRVRFGDFNSLSCARTDHSDDIETDLFADFRQGERGSRIARDDQHFNAARC